MRKRLLATLLCAMLALTLQPTAALAAGAQTELDISKGDIVFDGNTVSFTTSEGVLVSDSGDDIDPNGYKIIGTPTTNTIKVTGGTHNITLSGVNITAPAEHAAFSISGVDTVVNLTLDNTNTLTGGENQAGLEVPVGTTLTISGTGLITATGGSYSAGIGGGHNGAGGTVTIHSGTVTAYGKAAGIGGGLNGAGCTVTISGGIVTAQGENGMGIGGSSIASSGSVTISGGTVEAKGTICAFSTEPDLDNYPSPRTITISESPDGVSPATIESTLQAYTTYKYFKIVPPYVSIAGKLMTATADQSSYYTNGTEGAAGAVTTGSTEPDGWNAKLELADSKYTLTIKDLNLLNTIGGITSSDDLDLHILGEQSSISLSDVSNSNPAIFVDGDLNITCEGNDKKPLTANANNSAAVKVTGNLTINGANLYSRASTLNTAGTAISSIDVGGNLTVGTNSRISCVTRKPFFDVSYENASRAASVRGNVVMNGLSMSCATNCGIGLVVENGIITLNSGEITFSGSDKALSKAPDLSAHPSYIWSTDINAKTYTTKSPYSYSTDHMFISIMPTPSASISAVEVSGTANAAITSKTATITLDNTLFRTDFAKSDADVSTWFTNIPAGLTASIKKDTDTTATITFSGTPTKASTAAMTVAIPKDVLRIAVDLTTTNASAKWNINAASSSGGSDYPPAPVTVYNDSMQPNATVWITSSALTTGDMLITERNPQGNAYNALLQLADSSDVFATYNISLKSGIKSIGSALDLTFDLNEKYAGQDFTLVHQKADGTYEYFYDTADANGNLTFGPLYELSPFMLAKGRQVQTSYADYADVPKSGDSAQTTLWLGLVLMATALAGITLRKQKRD